MTKTAAQQQIEMLKRMKEGRLETPPSDGSAAPAAGKPAPRLSRSARHLPVGRETWTRLLELQASSKEFRSKKDMGEWAAALLLALPARAHSLDSEAREELFRNMREWYLGRSRK
jgi:hypothetical protein